MYYQTVVFFKDPYLGMLTYGDHLLGMHGPTGRGPFS